MIFIIHANPYPIVKPRWRGNCLGGVIMRDGSRVGGVSPLAARRLEPRQRAVSG